MVTATLDDKDLITASEGERPALFDLVRVLEEERTDRPPSLIGPSGEVIDLPEPIFHVLRRALPFLLKGDGIVVIPHHKEFTTQEAADFLNVSRQYVVQLCDRGEIPFSKAGKHRRIRCGDLVLYRKQRDAGRRKALRRLVQLSDEMGLYDEAPASAED